MLLKALEKVQKRATSLLPYIGHLSYAERLKYLKLPSLKYRMRRGDVIEVYKRLHGHYDDAFDWLQLNEEERTRNNGYKLFKPRHQSSLKCRMFSFRVIDDWNSLPGDVVNAPTLNCFKDRLDRFWSDYWYDNPL